MPQVDLEALVCGGGSCDNKIACETLAVDGGADADANADADHPSNDKDPPEVPPDFPPESFWLSKDAEFDWFDRNAFYERKESTKGNLTANPNSNSSSQRFTVNRKSKASIIGLPKTQKASYVDGKGRRNCRPPNIKLFPKRPESVGKSTAPVAEPSSPKVSCMGRVRSKKDRNRRWRSRKRASEPVTVTTNSTPKSKSARRQRTGFWKNLRSMFRHRSGEKQEAEIEETPRSVQSPPRRSVTSTARGIPSREPSVDPPGLGGMKRFVSGRRSESWSVDDEGDDVSQSESFDKDAVWRRR